MRMRLLCLGLLVGVSQVLATGCCPVARWRANHPYGICGPCTAYHPLLHPVQTRRTILGDGIGGPVVGPVGSLAGPVVTSPPCHGCGSSVVPGLPVALGGVSGGVVPVTSPTGYPPIGYPMPITPGPTVVPSHELPAPMPVKPPTN